MYVTKGSYQIQAGDPTVSVYMLKKMRTQWLLLSLKAWEMLEHRPRSFKVDAVISKKGRQAGKISSPSLTDV